MSYIATGGRVRHRVHGWTDTVIGMTYVEGRASAWLDLHRREGRWDSSEFEPVDENEKKSRTPLLDWLRAQRGYYIHERGWEKPSTRYCVGFTDGCSHAVGPTRTAAIRKLKKIVDGGG